MLVEVDMGCIISVTINPTMLVELDIIVTALFLHVFLLRGLLVMKDSDVGLRPSTLHTRILVEIDIIRVVCCILLVLMIFLMVMEWVDVSFQLAAPPLNIP